MIHVCDVGVKYRIEILNIDDCLHTFDVIVYEHNGNQPQSPSMLGESKVVHMLTEFITYTLHDTHLWCRCEI